MNKKDDALKLALESAAGLALEVLEKHRQMTGRYPMEMLGVRAVEELKAVFREMGEALAQQQEPVARVVEAYATKAPTIQAISGKEHQLRVGDFLYTSPPASKPLTNEETHPGWLAWKNSPLLSFESAFEAGVRFAEAAHGITGEQK